MSRMPGCAASTPGLLARCWRAGGSVSAGRGQRRRGGKDDCRMRDRVEEGRQCFAGACMPVMRSAVPGRVCRSGFSAGGLPVDARASSVTACSACRRPGGQAHRGRRRVGPSVRAGGLFGEAVGLQGADPAVSPGSGGYRTRSHWPIFTDGDIAPGQHRTMHLERRQATQRCQLRRRSKRAVSTDRSIRTGHTTSLTGPTP